MSSHTFVDLYSCNSNQRGVSMHHALQLLQHSDRNRSLASIQICYSVADIIICSHSPPSHCNKLLALFPKPRSPIYRWPGDRPSDPFRAAISVASYFLQTGLHEVISTNGATSGEDVLSRLEDIIPHRSSVAHVLIRTSSSFLMPS